MTKASALPALLISLAACQQGVEGEEERTRPYGGIAEEETVRFTGTEPFWGGEVQGERLLYSTPEDPSGQEVEVERFAGNNGISFSGRLGDAPLDLVVTPGECSDGMSDRAYPFVVTLQLGPDQRSGCAWTDAQPFIGPENP